MGFVVNICTKQLSARITEEYVLTYLPCHTHFKCLITLDKERSVWAFATRVRTAIAAIAIIASGVAVWRGASSLVWVAPEVGTVLWLLIYFAFKICSWELVLQSGKSPQSLKARD